MIANTSAPRSTLNLPAFGHLLIGIGLLMAIPLLQGCIVSTATSTAPDDTSSTRPRILQLPELLTEESEQPADSDVLNRARTLALTEGSLAARAFRAILDGDLAAGTLALIDSYIAWIEGDLPLAEHYLTEAASTNELSRRRVLAERQYRAATQDQWLAAAQFAHQRLERYAPGDSGVREELWSALMHLSDGQLESAISSATDKHWQGWLTLNSAYRQGRAAVDIWLRSHADHSAANPLPADLRLWRKATPPTSVAILLPLSGRLQEAGEAVLSGILEAFYQRYQSIETRPKLVTVDTTVFPDAKDAYRRAVEDGASLVIGPLTKADTRSLAALSDRPVPILALNRPEALSAQAAKAWSALSLAPEDEALQIAEMAFGRGLRQAMVIRPDTDWGRRMEATLRQRWRSLGGRHIRTLALTNEPSLSQQISALVGGAASEARIKQFEQAFEAPVDARPRRREDFDVVFLLAPDPNAARELRPLLVFHYSGDVPVYSPSTVNSGQDLIQNRDLNDIVFVETPAVLDASEVGRYTRLTALGSDAVDILEHLPQAEASTAPVLRGKTGLLYRRTNGEIGRRLNPATFAGGQVRPLTLP